MSLVQDIFLLNDMDSKSGDVVFKARISIRKKINMQES